MAGSSALGRGARGGATMMAGAAATGVIQLAGVTVLSRIIAPEDFGLVAMVAVFVALGNLVRDFGLTSTALQAPSLSAQEASNLFWMNSALGSLAGALLVAITPAIIMFYAEPRLAGIVPVMALVVLINGVGGQIQVQLARAMRYSVLALSDVASQAFGLGLAIVMALFGFGYWALIAQAVGTPALSLAIRWGASRWVPHRFRRGHGARGMLKSGLQYGLAYFLDFAQNNVDTLVIGHRLGAGPLGFYSRAFQLLGVPASRALSPLPQVVLPTLNKARAEGRPYQPILLEMQFAVGLGMTALFAITAGAGSVIIPIALGDGWEPSIQVFQILAIGGCFSALSTVTYWGFMANQQSRQLLLFNLVAKPLAIAGIAIGSGFGLLGVAWGYSISMAITWPLGLAWLSKTAQLPALRFLLHGLHLLLAGALGAVTAWAVATQTPGVSPLLLAVLSTSAGLATMLAGCLLTRESRASLWRVARFARGLFRLRAPGAES